jgi:hypothetical protein
MTKSPSYIVHTVLVDTLDETEFPLDDFPALVGELDSVADDEHPDVAVQHPSRWILDCTKHGDVALESLDGAAARRMKGVSRAKMIELLRRFAEGGPHALDAESWE